MAERAPRIRFLHAAADPAKSGGIRRLGVVALMLEAEGWRCDYGPAAGRLDPETAVLVAPIAALHALPALHVPRGCKLVVEIGGDPEQDAVEGAAILAGLGGRVSAVVARSAEAAAWARRHTYGAPIRLAHDPAADGVAIDAAACRFRVGPPPVDAEAFAPPGRFELWFAEPGDAITDAEAAALAASWRPETAIAVAPPPILDLLEQHGVVAEAVPYSPETLDEALLRADRCVFAGPESASLLRRLARARAVGAVLSADPRLQAYEPSAIVEQWSEILRDVLSRSAEASSRPATVLFLLDLIQDLDLGLPVLDALRRRRDVALRVAVSGWLRRRSPRVAIELGSRDLIPEIYDRSGLETGDRPDLGDVDAVVSVVESNRSAHARAHALFGRARELGLPSFSFQHGVENLGLNAPPDEDKDLALLSEHLFVWFPEDRTPDTVLSALRPRLVHVGRPSARRSAPPDLLGAFSDFASVAAVFENLHWNRYDVSWRRRFLFDCAEFAVADPTRAVVLKPHHGGLWSVRNKHLIPQWPTNLILADPTDPFWEPHTAPALIQAADLVITTPSTVALDAAQAGKPVAVAAYGLELPAYAPLPLLHELRDWTDFAAVAGSPADARRRAAFLSRSVKRADAAAEAAAVIAVAARDRAAAREARLELVS